VAANGSTEKGKTQKTRFYRKGPEKKAGELKKIPKKRDAPTRTGRKKKPQVWGLEEKRGTIILWGRKQITAEKFPKPEKPRKKVWGGGPFVVM